MIAIPQHPMWAKLDTLMRSAKFSEALEKGRETLKDEELADSLNGAGKAICSYVERLIDESVKEAENEAQLARFFTTLVGTLIGMERILITMDTFDKAGECAVETAAILLEKQVDELKRGLVRPSKSLPN